MGDLIFSVIDLSRKLNLNPETTLLKAIKKFSKRFNYLEQELYFNNQILKKQNMKKLNTLWKKAKENL